MRVAIVCTEKLPVPPIKGGAIQMYIEGVLPRLSHRHEVTVFGIEHPDLPQRESGRYAKFVRLPARSVQEYVEGVARELGGSAFDIVHVFNRPKWVPALHSSAPGSVWLLNLHNQMFHAGKISRAEAGKCLDVVHGIGAVSQFIKDSVASLYPQARPKIRVIYSGVDTRLYQPAWMSPEADQWRREIRQKHGLENSWILLFVGRLTDKKGAHIVLRALEQPAVKQSRVTLVVVGSKWYGGNDSDDYVRFIERVASNLGDRVVFTGYIPSATVAKYYAAADAFVCASQWEEPLSRTTYEAMSAGLPVITTSRGGNSEVVRGTGAGLIVDDYTNPREFAHHVMYLYDNPEVARDMGRTGRALAETRYTWERVAGEIHDLYEWAAGLRKRGGPGGTARGGSVNEGAAAP